MPKWDPAQYLRFERERGLPCRDLISRIGGIAPQRIIDLGCGAGTSTAMLRERWPTAELSGLDSSPEMIDSARSKGGTITWVLGDVRAWTDPRPFDLVFSNAALHWVPDHAELFPRLLKQLSPGGVLAVQMPTNSDSPAHRCIRRVAEGAEWVHRWPLGGSPSFVGPPEGYYDLLAPRAARVEIWQTEYIHVLPDAPAIVEWVKGTTLRPYLDALPSPVDRETFLAEITRGMTVAYPPQADGQVLFPFRRLFLLAHR
ncbi:MAG: methyltransferase domain-containing protein [Thermoplasmata archaeon]|nr:methyltransferase domain-containing protein [Thermoplasmata archaeon]